MCVARTLGVFAETHVSTYPVFIRKARNVTHPRSLRRFEGPHFLRRNDLQRYILIDGIFLHELGLIPLPFRFGAGVISMPIASEIPLIVATGHPEALYRSSFSALWSRLMIFVRVERRRRNERRGGL